MMEYMEYLNVPAAIVAAVLVLFVVSQVIGEFLELKGKVVPEFMKIRKYLAKRKADREQFNKMPDMFKDMKDSVNNINKHYNKDNIAMRDKWMADVNNRLDEYGKRVESIEQKLDIDNENILSILLDSKRNAIIDFAANVTADKDVPVTRERFNRMFKLYREYEDLIKKNGLTNGEIDIAYRMIVESYEEHMQNHTFIEDVRGWK